MFLSADFPLSRKEVREGLASFLDRLNPRRVLLLPPDYTRLYSGAGIIVAEVMDLLQGRAQVDVMPALGTHAPMSREECDLFFEGRVQYEEMIIHNWREDVVTLGEVPAEFVSSVSEGLVNDPIRVEVNRRLLDPAYDLILSVGQVVPHEVVGMANYSKNIFVGCGGSQMINASHMLGAVYGMERVMGRDFSPVRKVFDYAQEHFLSALPLYYALTVTTNRGDETMIHSLYLGRERSGFEASVALSREKNLTHVKSPFNRVVVYLDPREFKSTWLGNKGIYRTRMALADRAQLILLAPGIEKFGEDPENDRLIRRYGYRGRERILSLYQTEAELRQNAGCAAHLIHGSSDGRFSVTYAPGKLTREEVEGVGFCYADCTELLKQYDPSVLTDGLHRDEEGEFFYISNPALGLWTVD